MSPRSVAVTAFLAFTAAGCGGESDAPPTSATVELAIAPAGVLLTPERPSYALAALATDADGQPTSSPITWTSSDPTAVSVDQNGTVTALRPLGSALITATAGEGSTTIFAVAAEPVAGAVLLDDDDITGEPDGDSLRLGGTMTFRTVSPLSVGAVVVGTGEKAVAGRVALVDGDLITLDVVGIDEIFAGLDLTQTFRLDDGPAEGRPRRRRALPLEAMVGPFACEATGSLGNLSLAKMDFAVTQLETLALDVEWTSTRKKIVLSGQPTVTYELEPTLAAVLDGKIECKTILRDFVIPVPGPIGLFLGAAVPVGVGFEIGGSIPIAGVGVNLKGAVAANFSIGLDCMPGEGCLTIRDVTPSGTLTPTLVGPTLAVKVEPSVSAFVWADLEAGARFSSTLRIDGLSAQAGLQLAGSFASEEDQAAEDGYSAGYALTFEASAGPGDAVDDFLGMIGLVTSFLKFETSIDLGRSPNGVLTRDVESFTTGDPVNFSLQLQPATESLPVLGYNVASVRVYRQELRMDGTTSLILAGEKLAVPGQTLFTIPWIATVDGTVNTKFVAFATPVVFDWVRLEQSPTRNRVDVSGTVTHTVNFSCPNQGVTDRELTTSVLTASIDAAGTVTAVAGTYDQDAAFVSPCDGTSSSWTLTGEYVLSSGAFTARVTYATETTGTLTVPFECMVVTGVGCGVPPRAVRQLCGATQFGFAIAANGSYVFDRVEAPVECMYGFNLDGTFAPN